MRIAYQGEPGAYSAAAALRYSAHAVQLPCARVVQVFTAGAAGAAHVGAGGG